ncbi:MAG: amidohydrolase family protein, partial [Deltaproteobacteria bacterium]|nr:amidohydrolase family protein [Deltaproteobacteria bacterium]
PRRRGVDVGRGHSPASADQVAAALAAGAPHVTHVFNAMGGLHHRAPGLPGVALTADELAVELIADGVHVDRRVVDLAWRCKPRERLVLVSDGVAAVGEADGPRTLFGAACLVTDAVRRADTGQLAGSRIALADAVRNVARWCPRLPSADIVRAASSWPAASVGLDERAGTLAVGAPADLVLLDRELGLRAVVCRGEGLTPG